MSVLTQKLQEVVPIISQASKLFQTHNFRKSLDAYEDCINFCHRTQQDRSVIFNILSTKAALEYVLGQYDTALSTLNSVLSKQPYHFLCLMRRSQVYKKKNKLKRALKDLQKIHVFSPDNLQISAFKVQIEHLLIKEGSNHEASSESQDEQEQEEQENIQFVNLRLIDRKSSECSGRRERQSRVTILGDSTFEYKREEVSKETKDQEAQDYSDKAMRTLKQIQLDDQDQEAQPVINIITPKRTKKSILKNKGTSIFIQPQDFQSRRSKYLCRQSNLLGKLKHIDGKIIPSADIQRGSNPSLKEVQFRKSVSLVAPLLPQNQLDPNASTISSNKSLASDLSRRRSCLKRPSFEIKQPTNNKTIRKSRFQTMDLKKIDGKPLAHKDRKSIQNKTLLQNDQENNDNKSDSDNDASQHNIFGSNGVVMTSNLKLQFGISESLDTQSISKQLGVTKSLSLKPKHSILKKNSSVIIPQRRPSLKQKVSVQLPIESGVKKMLSKKSVMFNCTL